MNLFRSLNDQVDSPHSVSQITSHTVLIFTYKFDEITHGITYDGGCLFFPWGSPLLPKEFDNQDLRRTRNSDIYYLGTVNGKGDNGNYDIISRFAEVAHQDGHTTYVGGGYTGKNSNPYLNYLSGWISEEQQAEYLKSCYMSPALQGENQLINGMIPCRLFKSISYGGDGISNNSFAFEIFNGFIIFNKNPEDLYYAARANFNNVNRRKLLFEFVKRNHTYVNNVNAILSVL